MTDADFLARLPDWAFVLGLLIARIGCACMLFPGIGETELPTTIRAGFTLAFAAILLPAIAPLVPTPPPDIPRALLMIAGEIVTGLWLGWLTRLLLMALPIAGQIAADMAGMANILQPDPTLGPQTAALASALQRAGPVLLLATGLYRLPLAALAGSYDLIAPGALLPAADTAQQAAADAAQAFALGLRLASPFLLASMLWQVVLGLLARLVPQLQVFFAAMPAQILGGMVLLVLLAVPILGAWQAQVSVVFAGLPGL